MSQQRHGHAATPDRPRAAFIPPHRGVVQRKCACGGPSASGGTCSSCAAEEQKRVRRHPAPPQATASGARAGDPAPEVVHDALRGPSSALDGSTRAFFESRFDHDFSQVRIHNDGTAARSAGAIDALAYTVGNDVVFGKGQFSPHSESGRRLLAHELTHVTQQRGASSSSNLTLGEAHDASEQEADRSAEAFTRSGPCLSDAGGIAPGRVQRLPAPPTYGGATGTRDLNKLRIDAIADFISFTNVLPRTINVHISEPSVEHLTWELYDPNDSMIDGFSTLPGSAKAKSEPFLLDPTHFLGSGFVPGTYLLRCYGRNAKRQPVVYADRDFNVLKSDLTTGTALPTTYGELTFTKYLKTDAVPPSRSYSVDVELSFKPKGTVACTDVTFIQATATTDNSGRSNRFATNAEINARQTPATWSIDRVAGAPSPFYISARAFGGGTVDNAGWGRAGGGGGTPSAATLIDRPSWNREDVARWETCAICRSGGNKGQVYGCATWGYSATSAGAVTLMPRSFRPMPSAQFEEARAGWNTWNAGFSAANRREDAPALRSP